MKKHEAAILLGAILLIVWGVWMGIREYREEQLDKALIENLNTARAGTNTIQVLRPQ